MRVLLTGFAAFPGCPDNPTQRVVEHFRSGGGGLASHQVVAEILPVEYQRVELAFADLLDSVQPDIALSLGAGRHRQTLRLESQGVNLDNASIPDNSGEIRSNVPIINAGPPFLTNRLDLSALLTEFTESRLIAEISRSAGSYVCNHLLYFATYLQQIRQLPFEFLFIHVPTEENGFSLDQTVQGIYTVVNWLASLPRTPEEGH